MFAKPVVCACGGLLRCVEAMREGFTGRQNFSYRCDTCRTGRRVNVARDADPSEALAHSMLATFASGGLVPSIAPPSGIDQGIDPEDWERARVDPGPPEPGPELRRFDGSFVGYRAWKLSTDWQLAGTGGIGPDPWTPGVNEAKCAYGPHDAPHEDCQCGLYALASFDDTTSWWRSAFVLGAIEAWADVDEHNHDRFFVHGTGFRAQYAKIVLLAVSEDYPRAKNAAIRALASEHGADVCKREHLEAAAAEHGQLVPDELLEWAAEGQELETTFSAQMMQLSRALQISSKSARQVAEALTLAMPAAPAKVKPSTKGVKQTLRTPGPPGHGKFREGDRVRDSKGQVWQCVNGGKPGTWGPEGPNA